MELLFVALVGTLVGAVSRYTVPGRGSHGAMLLPAVGTAVAAAVWAALTWAGWRFDGGWIWVVSIVLAAAASVAVAILLPARRRDADAALLVSLTKAAAVRA